MWTLSARQIAPRGSRSVVPDGAAAQAVRATARYTELGYTLNRCDAAATAIIIPSASSAAMGASSLSNRRGRRRPSFFQTSPRAAASLVRALIHPSSASAREGTSAAWRAGWDGTSRRAGRAVWRRPPGRGGPGVSGRRAAAPGGRIGGTAGLARVRRPRARAPETVSHARGQTRQSPAARARGARCGSWRPGRRGRVGGGSQGAGAAPGGDDRARTRPAGGSREAAGHLAGGALGGGPLARVPAVHAPGGHTRAALAGLPAAGDPWQG